MLPFFIDQIPDASCASQLEYILPKAKFLPCAIIKVNTTKTAEKYEDLVCTAEHVKDIEELVLTLGKYGYWDLWRHHEKRLREIEDIIRPVHPLKFLGTIYGSKNPEVKVAMKRICKDALIRKNFLDGLSENLDSELQKRKIYPFLSDFAREVHHQEKTLKPFFDRKDWKGLLNFLTDAPDAP